jgi:HSP20 family protein
MLPSKIFFDDNFFKGEEKVKTDVYEKDGKMYVEMEAPGYTKDNIDISLDKGELTVTLFKESKEEENKKYLHRERRSYSKITRSFYLGDVEEDEVEAIFKNGVLVVSSPKKKEIETKRTINIKDYE